jgi:hypothetical protein
VLRPQREYTKFLSACELGLTTSEEVLFRSRVGEA